jgi:transposase
MNIKIDYNDYLKSVKIPRAAYVQRQFYYIFSEFLKKNIKLHLVFKFLFNLKIEDKLNLMKILFKFNMIYKGLKKIFSNEFRNMILIEEETNIYFFTRSKKF